MNYGEIHWATQAGYPLLATLQVLPLGLAVLIYGLRLPRLAFPLAIAGALLELLLAVDLYRRFDVHSELMQFAEHVTLLPPLAYHAAADGITVLFVLLTALLTLLIVVYGPLRGLDPPNRFLPAVFATQAAAMAMFVSVDLLWFVLVSAVQLGLVGHLLWRWATSPERDRMLTRYLQFMATGLALLLAGTLLLGWNHADATDGRWSYDLFALAGLPVAEQVRTLAFFLLFYGLTLRTPVFPLHGWLPVVAEHGNIAVAPAFLLGLKAGVYGLLRFVFPLLPDEVIQWHGYVVAFAVGGVFYAALLALLQENLRRLLAYAVISHTGILLIGLFSLNHAALQGGLLLAVNFGLAICGLLFMTGLVYRRTQATLLSRLGGLFDRIPAIGIAFLIAGLSIIGMPGTPGFDAVHLVLEASIERFGALVTIAAAVGNVVAAGFLLRAFQRAFLGPLPQGVTVERMTAHEWLMAGLIIAVLLGTGFHFEPWLELVEVPAARLTAAFGHE